MMLYTLSNNNVRNLKNIEKGIYSINAYTIGIVSDLINSEYNYSKKEDWIHHVKREFILILPAYERILNWRASLPEKIDHRTKTGKIVAKYEQLFLKENIKEKVSYLMRL